MRNTCSNLFAAGLLVLVVIASGCAETQVSAPALPENSAPSTEILCGSVEYTGSNPEWLPRSIRNVPGDPVRIFRYRYEVRYGIDDENAFDLFNPFLLFGATKSKDTMYVLAELEIESAGKVVKDYQEIVTLEKSKSVFAEGETLTAMRRTGLARVRDLIDARLHHDEAELRAAGMACES